MRLFTTARAFGALSFLSLGAALFAPSEAHACGGGTFYPDPVTEDVKTTGHRVVISVSNTQSVIWDSMAFKGNPADFAWVYPAKPEAVLETANDDLFDALYGLTATAVQSPEVACDTGGGSSSGCGCGSELKDGGGFNSVGGDQDTGVTIVHQGAIGPYDTVTISGQTPGAAAKWLQDNGYSIPDDVLPVLDDYQAKGFNFIALRLTPGNDVTQMQPVRVVTPGMNITFPLRMLKAGITDTVDLDIVALSEGRLMAKGFGEGEVDPADVTWDFNTESSNYADAIAAELGAGGFVTTFAQVNAAFGPVDGTADTLASLYAKSVSMSGKGGCDEALFTKLADPAVPEASKEIVNLCDAAGTCADPGANQIDMRMLECGDADDLAVALQGMHPKDVTLTRLQAKLPKASLDKDLELLAATSQTKVSRVIVAGQDKGDPCGDAQATIFPAKGDDAPKKAPPIPPSALALLAAGLAATASLLRRKLGLKARATA